MSTVQEKARPRKCHKCGWSWQSMSKAIKVSCPSCGTKVKVSSEVKGRQ